VDARVGRQISEVVQRLNAYRAAKALPRRVVVQVGDNGPLWYADLVRLRAALRGVPQVVFVTVRVPRHWQSEANRALRQFVRGWRAASLADWHAVSGEPGLLVDGAHPGAAGQVRYASVVTRALNGAPSR
jgi:hypothetical protein